MKAISFQFNTIRRTLLCSKTRCTCPILQNRNTLTKHKSGKRNMSDLSI